MEHGKKETILSLQALRALAFLGIFLSHCGFEIFGAAGAWGVSVFLMMSGFLLTYQYYGNKMQNPGFKNSFLFSLKKIKKLYPLHILMLIAAIPFIIQIVQNDTIGGALREQLKYLVYNLLLLQSWIPKTNAYFSWNGVSWYLSVCLFVYMVFPFVQRQIEKYKGIKDAIRMTIIVFAIMVVVAIGANLCPVPRNISDNFPCWLTYISPIYRVGDLIIGCNIGYIFVKYKDQTPGKVTASILEILTFVIIIFALQAVYVYHPMIFGKINIRYTPVFLLSSAVLVYLIAINKGIISKIITNRVLITLGNLSAYTFLIHQILIHYMGTYIFDKISVPGWCASMIELAVCILLAWLYKKLYSLVQKNFFES